MAAFVNGGNYMVAYDQTWGVQMMLRMALRLMPVLSKRNWSLWSVTRGAPDLVCSDSPVYLGWRVAPGGDDAPGFGVSNTVVSVPLNRRMALVGTFEPLQEKREIGDADVARLNAALLSCAEEIYSAERDFVWMTEDCRIGHVDDLLSALR
jgi:hypothetical protein